MKIAIIICVSWLAIHGHSASHEVTIYAVTFDGNKVTARNLPSLILDGADELLSGQLTQGHRHIRALSVQSSIGESSPLLEETKKLPVKFSTTCKLTNPIPQSVDIWIPDSTSKAKLTVKIASVDKQRAAFEMALKEAGKADLAWEFGNLTVGSFITFAFSRKSNGIPTRGAQMPSDLSDVIFLIIDYR